MAVKYRSQPPTSVNWRNPACVGDFVMLYELIFPVGIVAASVAGVWVVPHLGWQFMFVIGAAPAVLVLFLRRALPESPRGSPAVAGSKPLKRPSAVSSGKLRRPWAVALPPVQPGRKTQSRRASLSDLFGSLYLRRTLVVWVIWFASYLVNYGLSIWMPTVYRTVFKLPLGVSLQYGMITTAFGLVGAAIAAFLIDSIGRKPLFAVSFVGSAAALLVLARMIAHPTAQQALIYITIAYFFVSAINLGVYLYTPELYPTRVRALGRWDGDRVASAGLDDRSDRRRIYDRIRPPVGVHIFRVSVLCSRAGHCVVCDRNETTGTRGSVALNKSGLGAQDLQFADGSLSRQRAAALFQRAESGCAGDGAENIVIVPRVF